MDTPDKPAAGADTLVVRAVFVPDGQPVPAEFMAGPVILRFPATYDPTTGELHCGEELPTGQAIRAMWYPDEDQSQNSR